MKKKNGSSNISEKMHVHRFYFIGMQRSHWMRLTNSLPVWYWIEIEIESAKLTSVHSRHTQQSMLSGNSVNGVDWPQCTHICAEAGAFVPNSVGTIVLAVMCPPLQSAWEWSRLQTNNQPYIGQIRESHRNTHSCVRHSMFENRRNLSENFEQWVEWKNVSAFMEKMLEFLLSSMQNSFQKWRK